MKKKVKNKLLSLIDKALFKTNESINKINEKNILLSSKIDELIRSQTEQFYRIEEAVRNSGTIQISPTEIVTKIFNGQKVYLDPKDISVAPHLALDAIWEYNITYAWLEILKPTDIVVDIGANFGYFGLIAGRETLKKNSKVIFFEANPHLISYINKSISVNWLNEQSVVENLAVADVAGEVTLNILKDYIGSSSLHTSKHIDAYMHNKMQVVTKEKVTVKSVTLDSYFDAHKLPRVDLIKMDIEGFEDKAYLGMRKIIQKSPCPTLFIEFTKDSYDNPVEFYDMMLEDFGHVYLIDLSGKLIKPKNNSYEKVIGNPDDWIMPVFSKNSKLVEEQD